jgi:hypothetical protein
MGHSVDINKAWFQQDGVRPHTTGMTLGLSKETCKNRVLQNKLSQVHSAGIVCTKIYSTEMKRDARVSVLYILAHTVLSGHLSPDLNLNLCDSFLWGYLKDKVFNTKCCTTDDFKEATYNKRCFLSPQKFCKLFYTTSSFSFDTSSPT